MIRAICLFFSIMLAFSPSRVAFAADQGESEPRPAPQEQKDQNGSERPAAVVTVKNKRPEIRITRITTPPAIDGVLNDAVWQSPPLPLGEWLTYNPLYGEKLKQRTEVWAAYDDRNLYFAFRCLDPEPDKIKTSISRRDTMWNDDWVGMSLDSLGSSQSSYDMFVNPSGIQGDILTSSTSGEDVAPDWVWESAGKVTEEGYIVEIRVPLKSIRFKSGSEVRMGILFWRRISRLGMSASWPDLPPGQFVFGRHAIMILNDLKQPLTLELIPNLTYSFNQNRSAPARWNNDSKPDAGLTVKYGLTSSVTLDGTFNPDFSQVESDAFQVEVNQRFPIFFSEKRPFFMEGMGTFELAGSNGDANMRTAVHTRRITDPIFGMKLTGTVGKFTFATLSASDQAPGRLPASSLLSGKDKAFNVARAIYSLGKGSYFGTLATDTEFAEGHNRVFAGDTLIRIGEHQQWSVTLIGTQTRSFDGQDSKAGMAGQTLYGYSSKRHDFFTQLEHYDKDFQMDTAFYNRTGITSGWAYYAFSLYPDQKKYPWFKRFVPFVFVRDGQDRVQGGHEHVAVGGIRMHFTRQGFFRIHWAQGKEAWAGKTFDTGETRIFGGAQLLRWLNVFTNLSFSRSIFYHPVNPFLGNQSAQYYSVTLQPNSKLSQSLEFNHVTFDRLSGAGRVYTVDLVNTRTTYQLDKHFSLRAIARYDSSRKRVLTDFLGSFELLPGTVTYVGYGSLLEKHLWDGEQFIPGAGSYLNTQRGFFFKASYLYRF